MESLFFKNENRGQCFTEFIEEAGGRGHYVLKEISILSANDLCDLDI